jgi:hypothetical protein
MHDFRKENYIKAWKDDVLQLYNVMWYVSHSNTCSSWLMNRFAWLNARETRQRRLEEANAPPPPAEQVNSDNTGQNPPDRFRSLVTQVSAVRDEPTPISQSQSPLQSRGPSPEPQLNGSKTSEDIKTQDRLELSQKLFEAMLLQSDAPPPVFIKKGKNKDEEEERERVKEREEKDPSIKTSQLVRLGVLPMEVAYWGVATQLKNEQEEGGMDEFRLGLDV